MEFKFLKQNISGKDLVLSIYYDKDSTGRFVEIDRKEIFTPNNITRYFSYSSLVDNLYYQPKQYKNAFELGLNENEIEFIATDSSSYIFDKIPAGTDKVVYLGYTGDGSNIDELVSVEFGVSTEWRGVIETDYDQVLLLAFKNDDDASNVSPNTYTHKQFGNEFHRAYNAIQYQDSRAIMSKMLISAIFDTYDLDFSKGTLIGGDSSKYFVGNRVSRTTTPVIYEKIVDKIIDLESYSDLKGKTLEEIQKVINTDSKLATLKNELKSCSYISIEEGKNVTYCHVYEIPGGDISLEEIKNEDIPLIAPLYINEETGEYNKDGTAYIMADGLTSDIKSVFYPPSNGALFEYKKNNGEIDYYYAYSPRINFGIEYYEGYSSSANRSDLEKKVIDSTLSDRVSYTNGNKQIVGVKNSLNEDNKVLTVMNLGDSFKTLSEDENDWVYTSTGELILDKKQLKITYPVL